MTDHPATQALARRAKSCTQKAVMPENAVSVQGLRDLARKIVDRRLDPVWDFITAEPLNLLCVQGARHPKLDTDDFDDLVDRVREYELARTDIDDPPGPAFNNGCHETAGFLVGVELGRRLGGAR